MSTFYVKRACNAPIRRPDHPEQVRKSISPGQASSAKSHFTREGLIVENDDPGLASSKGETCTRSEQFFTVRVVM